MQTARGERPTEKQVFDAYGRPEQRGPNPKRLQDGQRVTVISRDAALPAKRRPDA